MAQKRIPLRMCAVCRTQYPKREMIRFVRSADGIVSMDETGKKPGRGFYVCCAKDCLAKAAKGTPLEKAAGVKIDAEILSVLKEKAETQ